jgi:hypothetical protein
MDYKQFEIKNLIVNNISLTVLFNFINSHFG